MNCSFVRTKLEFSLEKLFKRCRTTSVIYAYSSGEAPQAKANACAISDSSYIKKGLFSREKALGSIHYYIYICPLNHKREIMGSTSYTMIAFQVLGSLALLVYGMTVLSDALQKLAGSQLRKVLGAMTTNRFTGILTGLFITTAVQSSTATTVMTVSFVNAGLLTLAQAISVIMGANIGTTFTAWIMSLGYNINLMAAVYPAFFAGALLLFSKKRHYVGEFLFGVAFLFFSLVLLSDAGTHLDLQNQEGVLDFFASFDTESHFTIIIFVLIGSLITCIVQSSAAMMAITILLCSTGVLPIYLSIALVMGENIGTTATANFAALGSSTDARRAALAHLVFNVIGVIWVLCLFYPFVNTICAIVGYDPTDANLTVESRALLIPIVLAAFHTGFNVCNTGVLVWFVPQIERLVCFCIKGDKQAKAEEDGFKPQYITRFSTPELMMPAAQKEIVSFARYTQAMLTLARTMLDEQDEKRFDELYDQMKKEETRCDKLEAALAHYLEHMNDTASLSKRTKTRMLAMLRQIGNLERISDGCFNMAYTLRRRWELGETFTPDQKERLHQLMTIVDKAMEQMLIVLASKFGKASLKEAVALEEQINTYRIRLKDQNIIDLGSHGYSYALGTVYVDFIQDCERTADYIIGVAKAQNAQKAASV